MQTTTIYWGWDKIRIHGRTGGRTDKKDKMRMRTKRIKCGADKKDKMRIKRIKCGCDKMDKINLFHRPNIIGYSGDKIHRLLKTRLIPAGDSAACRKCIIISF
jgi:hypothetical protein